MSRIHFRSNTLVLWLSLFAAAGASALGSVGCSSSDEPGTLATAGSAGKKIRGSGGAAAKGGSSNSDNEAGDSAVGGDPDETGDPGDPGDSADPDEMGEEGNGETPSASGGSGGNAAGGSSSGGSAATEPAEGGSAGSAAPDDSTLADAQARAEALIDGLEEIRRCTTCHDVSYKGSGFYPNITPDIDTGIGSWSEEEIKAAIRDGKDKDGNALCKTMERYPFTDAQLSDLAVYLKHLKPVTKKITVKCPSP